MVNHMISKRSKLVQKEFKSMHDWVEMVIYLELYKRLNFDHAEQTRIRPRKLGNEILSGTLK